MRLLIAIYIIFFQSMFYSSQPNDIQPYQFAQYTNPSGYRVTLHKTIYQGCEIFIADGEQHITGYSGGGGASVAIALGRGCK